MENLNEKIPKKRTDKYHLEKRINEVIRLMDQGYSYTDILKICQSKWDLKERQIKYSISKAKQIRQGLHQDQTNSIKIRKRLEHHYEKYVQDGLDSKAVSVLKEINKMDRHKKSEKFKFKNIDVINRDRDVVTGKIIETLQNNPVFSKYYNTTFRDENYQLIQIKEITHDNRYIIVGLYEIIKDIFNSYSDSALNEYVSNNFPVELHPLSMEIILGFKNFKPESIPKPTK